jgi:hypothetical protein
MMRNKGEISTNTVITTTIAIIGIVLLGYAVARIYDNFANQENKNAQKNLENLFAKIEALKGGGESGLGITGLNTNWFVTGWSADDSLRPERCFLGSCICFCKGETNDKDPNVIKTSCQQDGICKIVDSKQVNIVTEGYIFFPALNCDSIRTQKWVRLQNNLISVNIKVSQGQIKVFKTISKDECDALNAESKEALTKIN